MPNDLNTKDLRSRLDSYLASGSLSMPSLSEMKETAKKLGSRSTTIKRR